MRIGIASDFHFGYGKGTGRENDSYSMAESAFELFKETDVDFVLLAGDLFDSSIPRQETVFHAMHSFVSMKNHPPKNVKVFLEKNEEKKEIVFSGFPVASIHGTHEFRTKDYRNILELLSKAGLLIYFNNSRLLLEKDGEKVAIFGMGGIPEKKALDLLKALSPKPVEGIPNIFVFHQSVREFLPTDDDMAATISLSDLPSGFDLYLDGHLHWPSETEVNGKPFVLAGSTIFTQMKRFEGKKPKGIFIFDTQTKKIDFVEFKKQRKLFYKKLKFSNASVSEVQEKVSETLKEAFANNYEMKPLIRIKLTGSLEKGLKQSDLGIRQIFDSCNDKAFISWDMGFNSASFKSRIKELREMQKDNAGIIQIGMDLLGRNLQETSFGSAFDFERMFELLSENKVDDAIKLIESAEFTSGSHENQ